MGYDYNYKKELNGLIRLVGDANDNLSAIRREIKVRNTLELIGIIIGNSSNNIEFFAADNEVLLKVLSDLYSDIINEGDEDE